MEGTRAKPGNRLVFNKHIAFLCVNMPVNGKICFRN